MAKATTRRYTRDAQHAVFTSDSYDRVLGKVERVYVGRINGGNRAAGTIVKVGHRRWLAIAEGDATVPPGTEVDASGYTNRADAADAAVRLSNKVGV